MKHEFTAIYVRQGEWVIAYCPEVPGANSQGRSKDEARENLVEAVSLILEVRLEDGLRDEPDDAEREILVIE
jgi:predicted RNase H-like HicB family nuclease